MSDQAALNQDIEEIRRQMMQLLEVTQRKTISALSGIDPERVVFTGDPVWIVRDVIGHLGVWNGEAAIAIRAHAEGRDYHCIESEAEYDAYNSAAVQSRRKWSIEQVWAEYQGSYDQLEYLVRSIPRENWIGDMLYPWNELGTIKKLLEVMMKHEVEHRECIKTG